MFFDSNILVAIGLNPDGAFSRFLRRKDTVFVTSEQVLGEVENNLRRLRVEPREFIERLRTLMEVTDQFSSLPIGLPLHDDDDRQILAEAIGAECNEFVTFNSRDFKSLYGRTILGVRISHVGEFRRSLSD